MSPERKAEFKKEMDNILKWGGTKEEQLSAFIGLVDDMLAED